MNDSDNIPYEKIGDEVRSIEDEIPFDIPDSWEWVRLGSISTYAETKEKINAQDAAPSIWGLDLEDIEKGGRLINKTSVGARKAVGDKTAFSKGDILYSKLRPYLLKILIATDDGICTPEIVPFRMYGQINADYIVYYLQSPYVDNYINGITYGVKMPRVGTDTMTGLLVPVPPIAEQERIVDKIKQVNPFVVEYDAVDKQSRSLDEVFPDRLKKSILQMAVQGKLVPQDPTDEPAEALLERIRERKRQLVKEGKIKPDKHESVIFRRDNSHYEKRGTEEVLLDEILPFDIPDSWVWVRLSDLVTKEIRRGKSPTYVPHSGVMVFAQKCNVKTGGINMGLAQYLDESVLKKYPVDEYLCDSDIVINSTGNGTLGRIGVFHDSDRIDDSIIVADSHVTIIRLNDILCFDYVFYALKYYQPFLEKMGTGSTNQTELKPATIAELLIPLPPLAEQRHIASTIL